MLKIPKLGSVGQKLVHVGQRVTREFCKTHGSLRVLAGLGDILGRMGSKIILYCVYSIHIPLGTAGNYELTFLFLVRTHFNSYVDSKSGQILTSLVKKPRKSILGSVGHGYSNPRVRKLAGFPTAQLVLTHELPTLMTCLKRTPEYTFIGRIRSSDKILKFLRFETQKKHCGILKPWEEFRCLRVRLFRSI